MFLEDEDWNDDKGDVPSPAVTAQQETSSPNVKTKVVGKKSLLRTLQTLGSVPEWKSEGREMGSDSETESPTIEHTKKKRKKHRRKRKHSETEEQAESTELSQGDTQDTDPPKKSKKDQLQKKVKSKTTDKSKDLETEKPGKEPTQASEKKLSRKQWKNRMKNKRKSKNKFRSQEEAPETDSKETDHNDNITSRNSPAKEVVKEEGKKEKVKSSEELKQVKAEDEKKTIIENTGLREPTTTQKYELNRKAQLRKEKLRKLLQSQETPAEVAEPAEEVDPEKEVEKADAPDPSASLRFRMEQRLESARFRFINEVLYSSTSKEARRMFSQDPQAFWVYHRGYSTQVQRWPSNPVDSIIQFIKKKPPSLVVADFGCGDCKIAKSVKNKVHSFDLVATCELVTACDMANVPLKDSSVDIAVFCLSLMGTNLFDFLKEANRVLKKGGFLKIAEVSSRFDDVRSFLTALSGLGFKLLSKDTENTHFYSFDFVKTGPAPENMKKFGLQLKPCVYKKR